MTRTNICPISRNDKQTLQTKTKNAAILATPCGHDDQPVQPMLPP